MVNPQLKKDNFENSLKSWCFNTSLLLGVTPKYRNNWIWVSFFHNTLKTNSKLHPRSYFLPYSLRRSRIGRTDVMHIWLINGKSASGRRAKLMRTIIRPTDVWHTQPSYLLCSASVCRRASMGCCRSWWPSLAQMMSTCWLVQLASSPTSPAITRATR